MNKILKVFWSAFLFAALLNATAFSGQINKTEKETKSEYIDIGSKLELFIDNYLIDKLEGAQLKMHSPVKAPHSSSDIKGNYMTIIKDGNLFRAYYRGYKPGYSGPRDDGNPGEITLYAESKDGKNWTYPELDLYKLDEKTKNLTTLEKLKVGKKGNNIILADTPPCSHNFTPFLDTKPDVSSNERFKALGGTFPGGGLYAFESGDGIHWKKISEKPVMTSNVLAFDSQNIAFWSKTDNCYLCYIRSWENGIRSISKTTSKDFINWTKPLPMNPNMPGEHLYTSAIQPYFRAPDLYIALPTRFLPDRGNSTDILLMTTRGGSKFNRPFHEAFIRPGLNPERWGNRSNYAAVGIIPTGNDEISIYHARSGDRYVLRTDGFASINAGYYGGQAITKPFIFSGKELDVNLSTSAAGSIKVEIEYPDGKPIPGFSLSDCVPLVGDKISGTVKWKNGSDVSRLSGKPVKLKFFLYDADIYSIRFNP